MENHNHEPNLILLEKAQLYLIKNKSNHYHIEKARWEKVQAF